MPRQTRYVSENSVKNGSGWVELIKQAALGLQHVHEHGLASAS
jgi:hypothetical protein